MRLALPMHIKTGAVLLDEYDWLRCRQEGADKGRTAHTWGGAVRANPTDREGEQRRKQGFNRLCRTWMHASERSERASVWLGTLSMINVVTRRVRGELP